jgi:hypothetical protein
MSMGELLVRLHDNMMGKHEKRSGCFIHFEGVFMLLGTQFGM